MSKKKNVTKEQVITSIVVLIVLMLLTYFGIIKFEEEPNHEKIETT